MARSFTGTDRITIAPSSTVNNLNAGTVLAWTRYTNATVQGTIYAKGTGGARVRVQRESGVVVAEIGRATTILNLRVADANLAGMGVNKWVFFAWTWNLALTDTDQKVITGDLQTVCAEASSYTTQTVGSGAKGDDSGANAFLGSFNAGSNPWPGSLGLVTLINRQLTLAEILSWQWYPRYMLGSVGLWVPGWDNGTSLADLSGNGNVGTITGTTRTADVPLDLMESLFGASDEFDSEPWALPGAPPPPVSTSGWPDRRRRAAAIWHSLYR